MVTSKDPEFGRNVGSYRLMYRTPTETGIDLVSPSDMRFYYQRALDKGQPLDIAIAIGVHPYEMLAASFKAPIDLDEYAIAGGLHREPIPLVKCKTVDLEVPADAEIVLEGEILPIGWTADEGPFGEFSQISGDVKWNPIFRSRCHRRGESARSRRGDGHPCQPCHRRGGRSPTTPPLGAEPDARRGPHHSQPYLSAITVPAPIAGVITGRAANRGRW